MLRRRILPNDVEHRVRVGVLDRGLAIGGGGIFVNHQHAGRTLACGFLIFVGPAAIIGHCLAAEIAFTAFEIWIVDEDDHDRSEEHTSELQSLMRISYADISLKK